MLPRLRAFGHDYSTKRAVKRQNLHNKARNKARNKRTTKRYVWYLATEYLSGKLRLKAAWPCRLGALIFFKVLVLF